MNSTSLPVMWAKCVNLLKDRVNNRSFWEALEMTVPITIEDDTLIIGMTSENFNRAGYIQQAANQNMILKTVKEVFNRALQMKIIDGQDIKDWDDAKEREKRLSMMRQAQAPSAHAPIAPADASSWDALMDSLARLYSQTPIKTSPQGKARYANEAIYLVVEAMDKLYPASPDDTTERSLTRAVDKIAGYTDMPASVVAFEVERLYAWRRTE